jgi:hypothetical protein
MTDLNQAQKRILAQHGLDALPAAGTGRSDLRLLVANAASIPDPAPEPSPYNKACRDWLGDRDPDKLDAESRKQFEWLRDDEIFNRNAEAEAAAAPKPKVFDPAKLAAAGLLPEARLNIARAAELLASNPVVGPATGITQAEVDRARLLTGEFMS